MAEPIFNDMEIDAIGEIMNISLGASATAVSNLLGTQTNITTPVVKIQSSDEFEFQDLEPAIGVEISYTEGLDGRNVMMFSRDAVRIIVGMMMGMEIPPDQFEMDEMNASAIREVMNQMMGASATALSEFLGYTVNISTPISFEVNSEKEFRDKYFEGNEKKVVVRFKLDIGDKLSSEFLNIMSVSLVKRLLEPFEATMNPEAAPEAAEPSDIPEEGDTPLDKNGYVPLDVPPKEPVIEEEKQSKRKRKKKKEETAPEPGPEVTEDSAQAPAEEPSAEDVIPSAGHPLNQNETDAILERLREEAAKEEEERRKAAEEEAAREEQKEEAPSMDASSAAAPAPSSESSAPSASEAAVLQLVSSMQQSQAEMMRLLKQMEDDRSTQARREAEAPARRRENTTIRSMNSPEYADLPEGEEDPENREMLMKVPLEISVEIGRTKKPIKEILDLTQGSLVVLDKMAGEQADLYVNGECIAKGDIVVVEDNFGIRITEILKKDVYQKPE